MKPNTFINYAHRGASEYLPENTMLSFYTGIYMGANGIETDVQKTKDGIPVLFHDDSLLRVTGVSGAVSDYTFDELQKFNVTKNGFCDKIVSFEDFLQHFSFRDITFAIELKAAGVEQDTADLLRKYAMAEKTVVTSFDLAHIRKFREIAPEFQVGLLTSVVNDEIISQLQQLHVQELCPKAALLTAGLVRQWHESGCRSRAWGVKTEELLRHAYDCGVDGMTVNFPDRLTRLLSAQR